MKSWMPSYWVDRYQIVLGKSGRNAFRTRLKELGFEMSETELNKAFLKFKDLADKKRNFRLGFGSDRE